MRLTPLFRIPVSHRTRRPSRFRLRVEPLESRRVPAGFSTFLGGSNMDAGCSPAVDSAGNTYVIGQTWSADFPATVGSPHGGSDVYVAKFGPDGVLLWAGLYGGSGNDGAGELAVDAAGGVYFTGNTTSTDFPTTPGAFQETPRGTNPSFVMKVDGTTGAILYSTYLSANGLVATSGIAVDAAGDTYLTGETWATDLPTTPGAFQPTFGGGPGDDPRDAFVLKLDSTGSSLVYATYLGGDQNDYGGGIAVDAAGNAYVTGETWADFPTTASAYDTTANGPYETFVTKLDPTGTSLVYSTYLGGTSTDEGDCIVVDAAGDAYVGGWTNSTDFPATAGAFDTTYNGGASQTGDAFIAKLDPTGSSLVYATYLGGSKSEGVFDLAVDPTGSVIVTSHTESPDFPTTPDALSTTLNGPSDIYVSKLDPTGSALVYSTYLGGSSDEYALGVATDRGGNAYVGGNTLSADFPTSPGAWQGTYGGGSRDAFVTKLAIGTDVGPAVTIDQAPGQADPASASPITFNVVFDAPVTGFDGSDVDFTGSTAGGPLAAEVSGSGSTYTVTVTGMTGTGTVVASIPAGAADGSGLPTQASTSTDNTVLFDNVVPTVTVARADGQAALTNSSPVRFLVAFSEPVVGFDASAVALSGTAAGAAVSAVDPGPAPDSYLVTVDVPGSQAGTVAITVPAGRVTDPAGNPNAASTGDATVAFDNVPPTVTVTPAIAGSVGGSTVTFAVVFSEPVVGFDASKVTWSAPAGGGIEVSGDGPAYTVTVSGMTAGGPVAVRVDAGAVADPAGNPNGASNDGSVTYVHSGTVQLSASDYGVFEHGGTTVTVTATRTGGSEGPLDVSFATADGTALAGTDYLATNGTLHWADGDAADQTFTVTIPDDGVPEPDSAFTVSLSDISLAGALGSPAAAVVSIYEEAVLAFTDPAPQVDEGTTGFQIPVHRAFGGHGEVSVTYTVTAGSATAGADYTGPAAGTLTWADGDTADRFITLDIPHDGLSEGKETVFLALTGTDGNAVLGGQTAATLTIRPSDGVTVGGTEPPRATFTDGDGDQVTLTLGGKAGRLTFYRTDGGGGISEIDLEGTDSTKTTVTVAVKAVPGGDGQVRVGEIAGTGLKSLKAKSADLVRVGINLTGFVGSLTIGDVLDGADIVLGGAPPAKPANAGTRITAGRLLGTVAAPTDLTFTDPNGRLTALTAVSAGAGTITAASVGSIAINGQKATKARPGVAGDFGSDLAVSGRGVKTGANAVGSITVAGTAGGSAIEVGGNVGSVRVGAFVDSSLLLGTGGARASGLRLGSFTATGLADATPAFADSTIAADRIGTVRLKSVGTADPDHAFGVTAGVSLRGLTVATPAFLFDSRGPAIQGLNLDQDGDLEFVVRVGP